ncbi:MAG: hypothetical protein RIQ52_57 [Pseudomonadota bacterium]
MDSSVLLHLFAQAFHGSLRQLTAIHVNHGIHPDATIWADHCARTAAILGVAFQLVEVDGRHQPGESPEDAARKARYGSLTGLIQHGDCLVTAQHQDDQAETLLLQLLRGAGPTGLASMADFTAFGCGHLARPLLNTTRHDIHTYALRHKISWLDDPSNLQSDYDRNYLRLQVIPILRRRWPALTSTLARSAKLCAESALHMQMYGRDQLRHLLTSPLRMNIQQLQKLSRQEQALAIRAWLGNQHLKMPSQRIIAELLDGFIQAAVDRNPCLQWSQGEFRRYDGHIFLIPGGTPAPHVLDTPVYWATPDALDLGPHQGKLEVIAPPEQVGKSTDYWNSHHICIRYRRQGDRILLGNGRHQLLSHAFQAYRIPPWQRDDWPLLCVDNEIVTLASPHRKSTLHMASHKAPHIVWHHPEAAMRFDFWPELR